MNAIQKLKAFKPLPDIREDETITLNYSDVVRINQTFVKYVSMLDDLCGVKGEK